MLVFGAPAVRGLGNAGGFKLMVEGTGDVDFDALQARADKSGRQGEPAARPRRPVQQLPRRHAPALRGHRPRPRCKTMGVALNDVFDALQAFLGSYYVNDFNRFGRTWQVNIQADAAFRVDAETVKQFKVRNADGDMVPLGAVADGARRRRAGVDHPLQHVPGGGDQRASCCRASAPATCCATMEELADKELPRNMTSEWTELSYLQKQASKIEQFRDLRQNPFIAFVLGAVLVFFVLAGLYESWSLPLAVILVVPMCLLCALAGVALARHGHQHLRAGRLRGARRPGEQERHPHRRVRPRPPAGGRVPVRRRRGGRPGAAAADHHDVVRVHPRRGAAGASPQGAGAEMRRTLGMAVFCGMLGVTLFGIFLTPVFFYVIRGLVRRRNADPRAGRRRGRWAVQGKRGGYACSLGFFKRAARNLSGQKMGRFRVAVARGRRDDHGIPEPLFGHQSLTMLHPETLRGASPGPCSAWGKVFGGRRCTLR